MIDINQLITVSEAARLLHVSEATVRSYEKRGLLRGGRLGNRARIFERCNVESLVAELAKGNGVPPLAQDSVQALPESA